MGLSGEASSVPYELAKLVASAELKRWIGVNPILPPVPTDMIKPTQDSRSFSAATDEALMGAITDRNENALEALYQRHGQTLRSIIESVIHEQAEAEAVLQETLLQIWKQAQNYAPRAGKPLGWLTTITRRRAIDRLRPPPAYIRAKARHQAPVNEFH